LSPVPEGYLVNVWITSNAVCPALILHPRCVPEKMGINKKFVISAMVKM
jgi:hypothetical protein